MLTIQDTCLLIVDVQGKLAHLMHEKEKLFDNLRKLIQGIRILGAPILWAEQNPAGLGPTVAEVAGALDGLEAIAKMSFSCTGNAQFMEAIKRLDRRQVLIAGIETHICVYQTTAGLLEMGYGVQVVADAVSSRTPENKAIGLQKMRDAGASLTSVETALFELLAVAEGEAFKAMLNIVK